MPDREKGVLSNRYVVVKHAHFTPYPIRHGPYALLSTPALYCRAFSEKIKVIFYL